MGTNVTNDSCNSCEIRVLVSRCVNMADPTKPSDAPGSASPISPQIKMPPTSPQTSLPSSRPVSPALSVNRPVDGSIPPNLPVKEGVSSLPTPVPRPPAQGPQPTPDIKLKPPSPSPAPSPVVQAPPKTEMPSAPVFKSSIRTMQEDIATVKKGQAPTGFQIEKQSEKDVTPPPLGAPGPKITMPPRPVQEVRLGELEKSRSLPGTKLPSLPLIPTVPPAGPATKPAGFPAGLSVPMGGGINKKRLIFLAGGLVVAAFLVWFFALRGPSAPESTPTPTPISTATQTPTPVSIENSFSIVNSASVALGANFITRFDGSINKELLISSREPALYKILNPATGNRYTLSEFLGGLLVQMPAELVAAAKDNFYLTVLYKSDNVDGYGLLIELSDPVAAFTAMGNWEGTMAQGLKDIFLLNPAKAASTTFLDNTYNGVAIRYRNFPDPNKTTDYAIVTASNGETYLVIANSREHAYSIIDKIK